ncbi:Barwin [Corchorus olitorius]|uniref:Barwin n=1 Tax=Corchorus olitorius TaxID=93759 RepID=A0A1R3JNB6_9ROSI|nr:Barwin [Corchorus olitorius]
MGRIRMSIILLLGCLVASATAQSASKAKAFYHELNAKEHHWDLTEVGVYCSNGQSLPISPWNGAANIIGLPSAAQMLVAVQPCIYIDPKLTNSFMQVTNLDDPNGEPVTVRILDKCTVDSTSLVLEKDVFDQMDTPDHPGCQTGHLNVSYKFVNCGDYLSIRLYPDREQ